MILPKMPEHTPKHTEEQLRLLATGCQNLALTLTAASVIAPMLNHSMSVPLWARVLVPPAAGLIEFLALMLIRYLPPPKA